MLKWFLFFFVLTIALLLETTLTTLPLVFVVLFSFGIAWSRTNMLLWSFLSGLLLDTLTFHPLGTSSIFFLLFFAVVFLYERKFEIQSMKFVLLFSFIASCAYVFILQDHHILFNSMMSTFLAGGMFAGLQHVYKKNA